MIVLQDRTQAIGLNTAKSNPSPTYLTFPKTTLLFRIIIVRDKVPITATSNSTSDGSASSQDRPPPSARFTAEQLVFSAYKACISGFPQKGFRERGRTDSVYTRTGVATSPLSLTPRHHPYLRPRGGHAKRGSLRVVRQEVMPRTHTAMASL